MLDPTKAAQLWAEALSSPDVPAGLGELLADDVTTVSALGTVEGREAVLAAFGQSPIAPLFAGGKWSSPLVDGAVVTMTCTFAAGAPIKGVTVALTAGDDGRVVRVESSVIAAQVEPQSLKVAGAMADAVNNALLNGTPMVVTYVDRDGQPHMSLRGTVQAFSDDQLAMWVRNPEGGLLSAIESNPRLALFYRDTKTRTTYQFHGRARADDAADVRERVYLQSPEPERNLDPQRRGVAVVVDLDRVEGRAAGTPILMQR